jgi:hypothetical protein
MSINKILPICRLVLDASAKPVSGFLVGNNFWLGSQATCNYANKKISIELSDRFQRNAKSNLFSDIAPFEVEWKMIYAKHSSPLQGSCKVVPFILQTSLKIHLHSTIQNYAGKPSAYRLVST